MFAANHRSFYDILLAYSSIASQHIQVAFISKIEIKKFPMIAQWMYFLNCLFMDRGNMKQNMNVILKAISLVKEGYSIYIAPEGTRNVTAMDPRKMIFHDFFRSLDTDRNNRNFRLCGDLHASLFKRKKGVGSITGSLWRNVYRITLFY